MSPLKLALLCFIPLTIISSDVISVNIATSSYQWSDTDAILTITLWFNFTLYQYTLQPTEINHMYTTTTFTTITDGNCEPFAAKIMVENNNKVAVVMDTVSFQTTSGAWYGIRGRCVDDALLETQSWLKDSLYSDWIIDELRCGSGISNIWMAVDNEISDSAPYKQLFYFDESRPNEYITDAVWEDATHVVPDVMSCNPTTAKPTSLPTIAPTTPPSSTPTTPPSASPSDEPTPSPTYIPTANPFTKPTAQPSVPPSNGPTPSPTYNPSSSPSAVVQSHSFTAGSTDTEDIINSVEKAPPNIDVGIVILVILIVLTSIAFIVLLVYLYRLSKMRKQAVRNMNRQIAKQNATKNEHENAEMICSTEDIMDLMNAADSNDDDDLLEEMNQTIEGMHDEQNDDDVIMEGIQETVRQKELENNEENTNGTKHMCDGIK